MEQTEAWLRLRRIRGITGANKSILARACGGASGVFEALDSELIRILSESESGFNDLGELRKDIDQNALSADLKWLEAQDNFLVTVTDADYPGLLEEITDPPVLLYATGRRDVLSSTHLGIVGSRNPTPAGQKIARDFAKELASAGLGIVSGLALGIDGEAHKGALDAGGVTIAVLANGLDIVYPKSHIKLAEAIKSSGVLVSEFPVGTSPNRQFFPRRNRIISGLSVGVLVVEAAARSGSLITARFAGEQGRDVFAIPGSIHSPTSKGCHALIKQGAKLVENTGDILEDLGWRQAPLIEVQDQDPDGTNDPETRTDYESERLLALVDYTPTTLDTVIERSGLTADKVSSMLLALELNGRLQAAPGGGYVRIN